MLGEVWSIHLQRLSPQIIWPLVAFVGASWLMWWLWRFKFVPTLWPREPKLLPYWVPYIGHTRAFMDNADALFNKGYTHFGNSEPFALTIGGSTTVVIRDIKDVTDMWKQTAALSYDPFVSGVFQAFGMSRKFVKVVFRNDPGSLVRNEARMSSLLLNENPQRKCYVHLQSDWLKTQLLSKDKLGELQGKFYDSLEEALKWENLSLSCIVQSKTDDNSKLISLVKFSRHTISHCGMQTFLGKGLRKIAPSFPEDYRNYEDDSWKIFFQYPSFMARDVHAAKERAIRGLSDYLLLPESERADLAWIFQTMSKELRSLDLQEHDIAGIVMMILWAINNNAHVICFWMLAHLLNDAPLLAEVRAQTDQACSPDGSISIDWLVTHCPHLDAVWFEVLRVYNATFAVRKAEGVCVIGGKTINKGDTVMGPFRQFHMNAQIFGEDARDFNPDRFLNNKQLHRTKGYAPFGGGHTYCPGRLFAQREIYMFIALTLYRFELSVDTQADDEKRGSPGVPPVDFSHPAAGALGPAKDVVMKLRPRCVCA